MASDRFVRIVWMAYVNWRICESGKSLNHKTFNYYLTIESNHSISTGMKKIGHRIYQNFEAFIIDRRQTPIAFPAFYFQLGRLEHDRNNSLTNFDFRYGNWNENHKMKRFTDVKWSNRHGKSTIGLELRAMAFNLEYLEWLMFYQKTKMIRNLIILLFQRQRKTCRSPDTKYETVGNTTKRSPINVFHTIYLIQLHLPVPFTFWIPFDKKSRFSQKFCRKTSAERLFNHGREYRKSCSILIIFQNSKPCLRKTSQHSTKIPANF